MQLARRLNVNRRKSLYLPFFELFDGDGPLAKKIAGYHQFHAVCSVIGPVANVNASRPSGCQNGGVVWHPQAVVRASP